MDPTTASDNLNRHLVIMPVEMVDGGFVGTVTKYLVADDDGACRHRLWTVIVDNKATPAQLAALLAFLVVDEECLLFRRSLAPSRPPMAMLLPDGSWRHSRSRTLPPWAVAEVGRIAQALVEQHGDYVSNVCRILRYEAAEGFGPVASRLPVTDETGITQAGPLPPRPVVKVPTNLGALVGAPWIDWRTDYRRDRYLRHYAREALSQRIADLLSNCVAMDDRGRIAMRREFAGDFWLYRFTEAWEEAELRYGPSAQQHLPQPGSGWPGSLDRTKDRYTNWLPATNPDPNVLYKFGKEEFLRETLLRGNVRVRGAKSYADASLNPAIRDDELTATLEIDTSSQVPSIAPLLPGAPLPRARTVLSVQTDYYIYCACMESSLRIAHDFEATACLVIKDAEEFRRRMDRALRLRSPPLRTALSKQVEYYDPVNVSPAEVEILTMKHFRYWYQQEWRFAWIPAARTPELPAVDIVAGNLEDICELVVR